MQCKRILVTGTFFMKEIPSHKIIYSTQWGLNRAKLSAHVQRCIVRLMIQINFLVNKKFETSIYYLMLQILMQIYFILSYFMYFILLYFISVYFILLYFVLFYFILSYFSLSILFFFSCCYFFYQQYIYCIQKTRLQCLKFIQFSGSTIFPLNNVEYMFTIQLLLYLNISGMRVQFFKFSIAVCILIKG